VDRICPFLALSVDHRTAIDGFDPDHFCHAIDPADTVDRQRQAEQCLVEAHRQCDRYVAFLASRAAAAAGPRPAPDAHLVRTRMIVEPEARRVGASSLAPLAGSSRRWLIAGGVAAVGVAAAATAIAGGFNGVGQRPAAGGAESTPTLTQQPTMLATLEPSNRPTDQPTQQPTSEPTRRPRNSASAAPEPVTYVVKAGDTLTQIASQFGTSVQAIKDANGLGSDVINVGQVLVIP
jgi:LysM repeat protein